MDKLTITELAYIAGLFDGEGCVGYYKEATGKFCVMLTISNTDFRIMQWLLEHTTIGSITKKQSSNKSNWKQGWTWQIRNRNDAVLFLSAIVDYLVIKKEQASLLLSHLDAEQKIRSDIRNNPSLFAAKRQLIVYELKRLKSDASLSIQ